MKKRRAAKKKVPRLERLYQKALKLQRASCAAYTRFAKARKISERLRNESRKAGHATARAWLAFESARCEKEKTT